MLRKNIWDKFCSRKRSSDKTYLTSNNPELEPHCAISKINVPRPRKQTTVVPQRNFRSSPSNWDTAKGRMRLLRGVARLCAATGTRGNSRWHTAARGTALMESVIRRPCTGETVRSIKPVAHRFYRRIRVSTSRAPVRESIDSVPAPRHFMFNARPR